MKPYLDYLPEFMSEYEEINEISKAENEVLYDEWSLFRKNEKNQWIKTADEEGIKRYEDMLNTTGGGNDLEIRRAALLVKYNNNFVYTYTMFKNYLNNICGEENYDLEILYGEYTVNISLGLSRRFLFNTVKDYARQIIPANMILNVRLKYNKHYMFEGYTHEMLNEYSHYDLRNRDFEQ